MTGRIRTPASAQEVTATADGVPARVWAPFGRGNTQSAFYDHGYKQVGEHYHASYEELLDCDLLGDEPYLRGARADRAKGRAVYAARAKT